MAKDKSVFSCNACGGTIAKMAGQVPALRRLEHARSRPPRWPTAGAKNRFASLAKTAEVAVLSEIEATDVDRTPPATPSLTGCWAVAWSRAAWC